MSQSNQAPAADSYAYHDEPYGTSTDTNERQDALASLYERRASDHHDKDTLLLSSTNRSCSRRSPLKEHKSSDENEVHHRLRFCGRVGICCWQFTHERDPVVPLVVGAMAVALAVAMIVFFGGFQNGGSRGASIAPTPAAFIGSTETPSSLTLQTVSPTATLIVAPAPTTTTKTNHPTLDNIFHPGALPTPGPLLIIPTLNPTQNPTNHPLVSNPTVETVDGTLSPSSTAVLNTTWTNLILSASPSTSLSFTNSASPQSHALSWMLKDPYSLSRQHVEEDGSQRILQRFAIVTIWYALGGPNNGFWSSMDWLQPTNECTWPSLDCDQGDQVEVILMNGYNLDGFYGTIPLELGLLTSLRELSIGSLKSLRGTIPSTLGFLTRLTRLDLSNNNLSGSIPTEIGHLTSLDSELALMRNSLEGHLPTELGQLVNLQILHLFGNENLTSTLPTELGQLVNVKSIHLYSNNLIGTLPTEFGRLMNLNVLYLWSNKLTGPIPTELGQLSMNLKYVRLSSNFLSGHLPTDLGELTKMKDLQIRSNVLTGSLPTELGNLVGLLTLFVAENSLTGPFPSELGKLTSITHLELYSNVLTGSLPSQYLGNLTQLERLYLYDNKLSGSVPSSLCSHPWFFAYIDCGELECSCAHLGTNPRCFDSSFHSCD